MSKLPALTPGWFGAATLSPSRPYFSTVSNWKFALEAIMKIAFYGLGNMGSHMARNLLRAGHDVTVWNRTLSKAEEFRSDNAKIAKSVSEAARDAEIAVTMLAD